MGIGSWFLAHGALEWLIVLFQQGVIFESLNHGKFNTIQGPWVKDNATFDHDPLTMAFSFK